MQKKIEEQRFEFYLLINGNIVCQRYFTVKGFNENSITHLPTLKEAVDDIVYLIKSDMLDKTQDYLWKYHNPWKKQTEEELNETKKNIGKKEDVFEFQIVVDKKPIVRKIFSGSPYPPKVRYQVNIKKIIPDIINIIRYALSQKKYDLTWASAVV